MALNVSEANAVNTLIRHLIGAKHPHALQSPTRKHAIDAIAQLADAAYKRLDAGYSGDSVRETLPILWRLPEATPPPVWWLEDGRESPEPDLYVSEGAARNAALEQWTADNPTVTLFATEWPVDENEEPNARNEPVARQLKANGHDTGIYVRPLRLKFYPGEKAAA
jgi:hypothetical protein